jgi:diguanylate cyclase (GGDEF)-like protein
LAGRGAAAPACGLDGSRASAEEGPCRLTLSEQRQPHLGLKLGLAGVVWLVLVAASFGWNLHQAGQHREALALQSARAMFAHLVLTRRWNAGHGGLFAPVSAETQPNPWLEVPVRDIVVSDDLMLTIINPAYMTRQLSELAERTDGVQFRITSRNPIRPQNAPRPWEAEALAAFEAGVAEVGELQVANGQGSYRYMAPLMVEQACLACHEEQGYTLGDVRGGISIMLPGIAPLPLAALVWSHVLIALAGGLTILLLGRLLSHAYADLRTQAVMDALTSIPNRRYFIEQFVRTLRPSALPVSLIICDIDHFKGYNDCFGHQAGDHCLQTVAGVLHQSRRHDGDFCARYGGEEFVLVLPNTRLPTAVRVAERLREAIADLGLQHPGSPLGIVTISVGVAAVADGQLDHEALIHDADEALYRAKEQGRNRVAVHPPPAGADLYAERSRRSGTPVS